MDMWSNTVHNYTARLPEVNESLIGRRIVGLHQPRPRSRGLPPMLDAITVAQQIAATVSRTASWFFDLGLFGNSRKRLPQV
jgi:hypothetical protein